MTMFAHSIRHLKRWPLLLPNKSPFNPSKDECMGNPAGKTMTLFRDILDLLRCSERCLSG